MNEVILERLVKAAEEQARSAGEQLKWTRLFGLGQLKSIFEKNLISDGEKLVYEYSDGLRSTRDLERMTGVGKSTIALLWKKWFKMGLMEKSEKYEGRRMRRSFSLEDAGIDIPPLINQQQVGQTQSVEDEFE